MSSVTLTSGESIVAMSATTTSDIPLDDRVVGDKSPLPHSGKRKLNSPVNLLPIVEPVKAVSVGAISGFILHDFVLLFENEPWWILALRPQFVKTISFIQGWATSTDCYNYITRFPHSARLFNKDLISLSSSLRFGVTWDKLDTKSIVLVTGSVSYYNSLAPFITNKKTVFITDTHTPSRRLPKSTLPLERLRHQVVGGATNFSACISYLHLSAIPNRSALRRSIKHFLDFGLRPRVFGSTSTPLGSYLTPAHILPLHQLHTPVVYSTYMTSTGEGYRQLSIPELCSIFGLESSLNSLTTLDTFPFVPIQLMDSILHPILTVSIASPSTSPQLIIPTLPLPRFTHVPNLPPHVSSILPITWSEVDYSAQKAAKNDNAEPVFRHWNERVILILPHAVPLLDPLRRWLLFIRTRRLYLEFRAYLCATYGTNWSRLLHPRLQGGAKTFSEASRHL